MSRAARTPRAQVIALARPAPLAVDWVVVLAALALLGAILLAR